MMARLRLPRMLAEAAKTPIDHEVAGGTVAEALASLFEREPGLENHILDDFGSIRPHVTVFVDGVQAGLSTSVGEGSQIRILHAVSGG